MTRDTARARRAGRVHLDPAARLEWHDAYARLSAPAEGLVGSLCARAEAHAPRLATLYAFVDGRRPSAVPTCGPALPCATTRRSYRAFATGLGFFPEPEVSVTWTLVITAAAVGTGLLASAGPAFGAARSATADALRQE